MKKLLNIALMATTFFLLSHPVLAETLNVPRPSIVPDVRIGQVISAVVGFLLVLAAVAAFLFLILGGIQWITSGGDKAGMEAARNRITAAIVGLIIVAAAWAVMLLVGQFIGFDLLKSGGIDIPTIPGTPK